MSSSPRLIYLNADFDISLRDRPISHRSGRFQQGIEELSLSAIVAGTARDRCLVRRWPDPRFIQILSRLDLDVCQPILHPGTWRGVDALDLPEGCVFEPYAWSGEAIHMAENWSLPSPPLSLDVVKRVNSREFSLEVEKSIGSCPEASRMFTRLKDIETFLETQPPRPHGWVVKSTHGNAGLANRKVPGPGLDETDSKVISGYLAEDAAVQVEPWFERIRDISASGWVQPDGTVSRVRKSATETTAQGSFIGIWFEAGDREGARPGAQPGGILPREEESLDHAMRETARALGAAGYHGPFGIDGFVHDSGGTQVVRAPIDINARHPLSFASRRLFDRLGDDRQGLWRFYNDRKFNWPPDHDAFLEALGSDAFAKDSRRGVILTTPTTSRITRQGKPVGDNIRTRKLGVLFIDRDPERVRQLEQRFFNRFARRREA